MRTLFRLLLVLAFANTSTLAQAQTEDAGLQIHRYKQSERLQHDVLTTQSVTSRQHMRVC